MSQIDYAFLNFGLRVKKNEARSLESLFQTPPSLVVLSVCQLSVGQLSVFEVSVFKFVSPSYSQMQIGWHSILRLILKTFNLVPCIPGLLWVLSFIAW